MKKILLAIFTTLIIFSGCQTVVPALKPVPPIPPIKTEICQVAEEGASYMAVQFLKAFPLKNAEVKIIIDRCRTLIDTDQGFVAYNIIALKDGEPVGEMEMVSSFAKKRWRLGNEG